MRIGIYAPYLAALGGGEKYILVILSEALALPGAEVRLLAPERPRPAEWDRLNVGVDPSDPRLAWVHAPDDSAATEATRGLDLFIAIHNLVPPESFARRSVAVLQFPFGRTALERLRELRHPREALPRRRLERARVASYDAVVCYSEFVRRQLAGAWGIDALVVHPPVDLPENPRTGPREPSIVSVGRFFRSGHNKKQDVLVRAFGELWERRGRQGDLRLHLVGGAPDGPEGEFLGEVRALAEGLPVSFHVAAPLEELRALYASASLYWHATGYGESQVLHPERMEHFGIAPLEAMAYGCVVLTVPKGGQQALVQDGVNGRYWKTTRQLVERSSDVLDHEDRYEPLRRRAIADARAYGTQRFRDEVRRLILAPAAAASGRTPAAERA